MKALFTLMFFCFSMGFAHHEKYVINDVTITSSFNDFADVVVSVDVTYAPDSEVCCLAQTRFDCEFDNSGTWERAKFKDIHNPATPITVPLNWVADVPVTNIAYKGNGDYRIEIDGFGDGDPDYSGWYEFSVTDVVAPATMANAAQTWSSNHPKVTWDANTEIDLQYYEVYKKYDTDPWPTTPYATTTNEYYTDVSEFKYSIGNDKAFVYYRMKAVDYQGNKSAYTSTFSFTINAHQENVIALNSPALDLKLAKFQLSANYPNPFNPETKISFALPELSNISIKVYNILGKEVASLSEGSKESGFYTATFDGSALTSGVYIYRFVAKSLESDKTHSEIKRMVLIK